MELNMTLVIVIALLLISPLLSATEQDKTVVHVFYKQKGPSQKALEKVNEALESYKNVYEIRYIDILDEANLPLIESFGLPATHFPIAVVIGGKFTIQRDIRVASFVHFPSFMKGIGRHEGNWSIADLEAALKDNSLLLNENILPELVDEVSESKCE